MFYQLIGGNTGFTRFYKKRQQHRLRRLTKNVSDQVTATAKYKTQHICKSCLLVLVEGGENIQQRSEFLASQWSLVPLPVLCIHACALSAHTHERVSIAASATHLWLAATPLSLPGAGTVYLDILGLIVLHINMTRTTTRIRRGLTLYRVSYGSPLMVPAS